MTAPTQPLAPESSVVYSRMAAALMNSPVVQALPVEQRWALRDVLVEHDSIDSLPPHMKALFSDSIHPHLMEAEYTERLHPRNRFGRWIDKPKVLAAIGEVGDLVRGTKIRGGKGRRGPVRGKAKGWLERVNEIRSEPILEQNKLRRLYREAQTMVAKGEKGGFDPLYVAKAQEFLDEWWGYPKPGRIQTVAGDPGSAFQEQHARIMEAGAHIDAEINRRLDEKGNFVKRLKQFEAEQRNYVLWRKEAVKAEEDAAYDALARELIATDDFDPERVNGDWVRKQHIGYLKEMEKARRGGKIAHLTHIQNQVGELWDHRFNIAERHGINLQALYDKSAEARHRELTGSGDVRAARAVLDEHRRDVAYGVIGEIRPFAAPGVLDFIDDPFRYPYEMPGISIYDTKHIAAPKLAQAACWLPTAWIMDSNRHPTRLVPGWASRGKYIHSYVGSMKPDGDWISMIVGSPSDPAPGVESGVGTFVHELVHRAEATHDGIRGAEWAFYVSRVAKGINQVWEDLKPLRELTGNNTYREDERTRPDDFVDVYAGKSYGDGFDSDWEILSMGIEDLVTGQHGIVSQDEEYRHFVLGALATL